MHLNLILSACLHYASITQLPPLLSVVQWFIYSTIQSPQVHFLQSYNISSAHTHVHLKCLCFVHLLMAWCLLYEAVFFPSRGWLVCTSKQKLKTKKLVTFTALPHRTNTLYFYFGIFSHRRLHHKHLSWPLGETAFTCSKYLSNFSVCSL